MSRSIVYRSRSSGGKGGQRFEVVPGAEVPVACAGDDRCANVAVLPHLGPRVRELVRCLAIEDVGLFGVVDGYVSDMLPLLIVDGHSGLRILAFCMPETAVGMRRVQDTELEGYGFSHRRFSRPILERSEEDVQKCAVGTGSERLSF